MQMLASLSKNRAGVGANQLAEGSKQPWQLSPTLLQPSSSS